MKSNFFKLCSMFLCGAMLAFAGCADFEEDIQQVAGDVDAVEVSLDELQSKLADLEEAQDALEATVALKTQTEEIAKDVAAIETAIKSLASQDDVDAVAKKVSELESALKGAQETLAAYATKKDLENASADLQKGIDAVEAELQKSIDAVKTSLAEYAKASDVETAKKSFETAISTVNTSVADLTKRVDAAENQIKNLETVQKGLESSIADVVKKLENYYTKAEVDALIADLVDAEDVKELIEEYVEEPDLSGYTTTEELTELLKAYAKTEDVTTLLAKKVDTETLNETLKAYATVSDLNAVKASLDSKADKAAFETAQATLAAAGEALTETMNTLNGLIDELYESIQSLVFIPKYSDMCATLYEYTINGKQISEYATVKATFKVTPTYLVKKIENGEFTPYILAKNLLDTRAADADAEAEEIFITNYDDVRGTFDVEAVFDADDVSANSAIALYLVDENKAALEDDAFSVGGETADLLENAYSSAYVKLADSNENELMNQFVLYNGSSIYSTVNDEIQWSVADNARTPLKGYAPHIELDGNIYTLDEAAEILHVDVADITPRYKDQVKYTINGTDEKAADCKAQVVTSGSNVVERTIAINGTVTVSNAGQYVGHKVAVDGSYYFQQGIKQVEVINADYSYEIVNRKIEVLFESVEVAWSYALAESLSSANIASNAYDKDLDKTADDDLSEVSVLGDIPAGYDMEKILLGTPNSVKINGADVANFKFTADLVAHKDAQIAEIAVTGYKNLWGKTNNIKQVYNITADYTDIEVYFTLILGSIPEGKSKSYNEVLPLSSNGYIEKSLPITSDLATLAGISVADFNKAIFGTSNRASTNGTSAKGTVWEKGNQNNTRPIVDNNYTYIAVKSATEQGIRISTNNDLIYDNDKFVFKYEVTPWYYAGNSAYNGKFTVNVNATVDIPPYSLEPEAIWVAADNTVDVPGHTADGVWVINDVKLHTYVDVLGVSSTSTDKLFVKWEVVTLADPTKGYDNVPAIVNEYSAYDAANGTLGESIISWSDYTALDLKVKATLVMKKYAAGELIASNLVQVGEPIELTFKTKNMIQIRENASYSVARNGQPSVEASFADALSIFGLDASEGSIDYEMVNGVRQQKNFIINGWKQDPLWSEAVKKYGLELTFDENSIEVIVDGVKYALSSDNYVLANDFVKTGKFTFKSNEALLQKDVKFLVDAKVAYNRDYMGMNQVAAETDVTLSVTISK